MEREVKSERRYKKGKQEKVLNLESEKRVQKEGGEGENNVLCPFGKHSRKGKKKKLRKEQKREYSEHKEKDTVAHTHRNRTRSNRREKYKLLERL